MRKAGIPCQYFCRKSFATWDVLLPTEEQAAKLAANNITTKYFRLQPEYRGTRRLQVTICNVPAHITGEVLAAYLSSYGQVEEYNLLRSPAGTAYGDYAFRLCLTRDGFKAIPETLISGDRQMIVMVEGRRPRCWSCKKIGHISKFCPEKLENAATAATAATTTTTTTASTATISKTAETQDPSQGQPKTNDKEGWSEVTRRRGSPKQGEKGLSKCARLLGELRNLCVDVAAVQETHFTCGADCRVLESDFNVFSAYGSNTSAGVSLLVGRSLDADVDVVFAGDGGRLVVADVAVKSL